MSHRHIFHLSIPVHNLDAARKFYVEALRASVGRQTAEWLDILLWGHQITLQLRPQEVLSLQQQGKRHFGIVLPWMEWEDEVSRLTSIQESFHVRPKIFLEGTQEEQAKFYLADPSNNIIEVKAYRNPLTTLGIE